MRKERKHYAEEKALVPMELRPGWADLRGLTNQASTWVAKMRAWRRKVALEI
jgi:hypothetical protein